MQAKHWSGLALLGVFALVIGWRESTGSADEPMIPKPGPIQSTLRVGPSEKFGVPKSPITLDETLLKTGVQWRQLGPAIMGGRVTQLAIDPSDNSTFYIATASGGIFKTENAGTTFAPIFDDQPVGSIGAIAVAESNPNVIWVGTGEANARNSVSWGKGVYCSTDGGKTFQFKGLENSFQIGRIVIDPTDENTVYVAACGRLWGPSEERGLYKTIDAGKTWKKILAGDEKTGAVEITLQPGNPNVVIAALWERQRDEFDTNDPAKRWGPGSGLYRSTDAGKTWKRLEKGLPNVQLGRMGVAFCKSKPNIAYAVVESEKIGQGPAPRQQPGYLGIRGQDHPQGGAALTFVAAGSAADKAGLKAGDRIIELNGKEVKSFRDVATALTRKPVGFELNVVIQTKDKKKTIKAKLGKRPGSQRPYGTFQGGQRANMQGRQGKEGFQTGGVYKSTDAGVTWNRVNSLCPRPFYYSQVRVDPTDPESLYVLGVDLFYSGDGGKSFSPAVGQGTHPDHHDLWIDPLNTKHLRLGNDGGLYESWDRGKRWTFHNRLPIGQFYHVAVDNEIRYKVYGGLQDNGTWGGPGLVPGADGPTNADWNTVSWGDGFVCRVDPKDSNTVYYESQNGGTGRADLKTGRRVSIRPARSRTQRYRFNWRTPFTLSPQNSRIYYSAGNYVFRSLDRGNNLKPISPEISRTKRGTATALACSPSDEGLIYVGTDDGALWRTDRGAHEWKNLSEKLSLPGPRYVASLEPSRFSTNRVYAAFDGHRSNDDLAHVLVSDDRGEHWKSLRANLPATSARVLREDRKNPNLLYLGTEFGLWISLDRGQHWNKVPGLPPVAVHEVAQPAHADEVVLATHGRSLWVLDVTPFRQWAPVLAKGQTYLFQPSDVIRWVRPLRPLRFGHDRFQGENPSRSAQLYVRLDETSAKDASLEVFTTDARGNQRKVRTLKLPKKAGFHGITWDLRQAGRRIPTPMGPREMPGRLVNASTFEVVLTAGGVQYRQPLRVMPDPTVPEAAVEETLQDLERRKKHAIDF